MKFPHVQSKYFAITCGALLGALLQPGVALAQEVTHEVARKIIISKERIPGYFNEQGTFVRHGKISTETVKGDGRGLDKFHMGVSDRTRIVVQAEYVDGVVTGPVTILDGYDHETVAGRGRFNSHGERVGFWKFRSKNANTFDALQVYSAEKGLGVDIRFDIRGTFLSDNCYPLDESQLAEISSEDVKMLQERIGELKLSSCASFQKFVAARYASEVATRVCEDPIVSIKVDPLSAKVTASILDLPGYAPSSDMVQKLYDAFSRSQPDSATCANLIGVVKADAITWVEALAASTLSSCTAEISEVQETIASCPGQIKSLIADMDEELGFIGKTAALSSQAADLEAAKAAAKGAILLEYSGELKEIQTNLAAYKRRLKKLTDLQTELAAICKAPATDLKSVKDKSVAVLGKKSKLKSIE